MEVTRYRRGEWSELLTGRKTAHCPRTRPGNQEWSWTKELPASTKPARSESMQCCGAGSVTAQSSQSHTGYTAFLILTRSSSYWTMAVLQSGEIRASCSTRVRARFRPCTCKNVPRRPSLLSEMANGAEMELLFTREVRCSIPVAPAAGL